jgi:hypothetical protein
MGRTRRVFRLVGFVATSAALVAAAQAPAGKADGQGNRGPKVVQLQFSSGRGIGEKSLQGYAYRTDVLRFRTSYEGERATADSRYRQNVADTDIDAKGEARHPWELLKKGGGKQVIRMIRQSLRERGEAVVQIFAHRDGKVDDPRVRIELSECSEEPPIYPISCEVEV